MRCVRCNAELREAARFCNKCGARQDADPTPDVATGPRAPGAQGGSGLVRRPSRPLRRPGDAGYGVAAPISIPLPRETIHLDDQVSLGALPHAADVLSERPAGTADAFADLPTRPYSATPPQMTGASGTALRSGMPWPLPIGVSLLDRYQIVAVVEAQPEAPDAVNTYRVVDLMGYLRCWSCGAEHGAAGAGERFCPACGADMLGHEYLLTERRGSADMETQPRLSLPAQPAGGSIAAFTQQDRRYEVSNIQPETPLFPFGPHVSVAGMSNVGMTRAGDINEDSFGALCVNLTHDSRQQPLALAIVADGLGGHANGQEASRLASRIFIERLNRDLIQPFLLPMGGVLPPEEAVAFALREAVTAANAAIYEANVQGSADMGSTLVAAIISGERAWIANVGDSRGYVMDEAGLRRITSDHSLVEQLIVSGMIEPEERYTHAQRNRIFRSLGGDPTVEVDIFTQRLTPGMVIMLCSDGMWEMTRDPEMEAILRAHDDLRAACEALVASANNHGGEDNITVVIARADA
ncbi:MAG TPA: protein phosphatase 2C domain-containing protein [Ktedonobacterales bacterium]